MKIVLDIEENSEPRENDIIVFKNGKWKIVPKSDLLNNHLIEQTKKNKGFEKEIKEIKEDLMKLAKIVKEK